MFVRDREARLRPVRARTLDQELVRRNQALLLEAATRLFKRKGFHNTTIADVAAEAGMSVGSVYRYVSRKDDLLLLLFRSITQQYEAVVAPVVAANLPAADKLRKAFRAYLDVVDRESDKAVVAYRDGYVLDPEGRAFIMRRELETNGQLEEIIREGIRQGEFRPVDPGLAAYNIIMAAHMWALKRWYFRRRMSVDEYATAQTDLFLAAIRREVT